MSFVLRNAKIYYKKQFVKSDLFIKDGLISDISPLIDCGAAAIDMDKYFIFPGLIDVHVHLREPGFSYKETIASGTLAAAHGGFTAVCAMPNLLPVPDSPESLEKQEEIIRRDAKIHVYPYGAITCGELGETLSDMKGLAERVCAFSDDGRGVQNALMMKQAMISAKSVGKIIAAHCEDNGMLRGGYIHDGEYARTHGHKGISSMSEWAQIERDIKLARETGCAYHVCHISCAESVELIRRAKADGVNISCETAPHYLVLDDSDIREEGRFKMNPPLRSSFDREALIEGIKDGTIDMIATDHAPHSVQEKSGGLKDSLMGVSGIECAFPVLYTKLVDTGVITLERLIELMHDNPAKRFGIGSCIEKGAPADFTVYDLTKESIIDPGEFLSKGKSTPFEAMPVKSECVMTVCGGRTVWKKDGIKEIQGV